MSIATDALKIYILSFVTYTLLAIYATMVTIVSYSRPTKSNTKDVTFYYIRYGTLPASITGHLRSRSSIKKEIRIYAWMGYLHDSRNAIAVVTELYICCS